jgi:hypothetical protein
MKRYLHLAIAPDSRRSDNNGRLLDPRVSLRQQRQVRSIP